MPTHNALPTSFSLPISGHSAMPVSSQGFDYNSIIPSEYDWRNASSTMMDLDVDDQGRVTSTNDPSNKNSRKLEFVDLGSDSLGLGDLDISFDASPSENGKIRVRIHSSASQGSSSSTQSTKTEHRRRSSSSSSLAMWAGAQSDPNYGGTFSPPSSSAYPTSSSTSDGDPFFGVGGTSHSGFGLASPMSIPMSMGEFSSPVGYGQHTMFSPDFSAMAASRTGSKRRVRIALKSMPIVGGEGGEWEIELR